MCGGEDSLSGRRVMHNLKFISHSLAVSYQLYVSYCGTFSDVALGLPLKLQHKLSVDKSKLVGGMHISYKTNC